MNKKEFLNELENALYGKLSEADIREVTSDYGDIFDQGIAEGKSEEDVARELGSPARIARTIMEDGAEGTERYVKKEASVTAGLASMPKRLGAYIIDGFLLGAVAIGIFMAALIPYSYHTVTSATEVSLSTNLSGAGAAVMHSNGFFPRFAFMNIVIVFILLGVFNLFTTIILWATNGYTPGKWLLGIRVVKTDGSKIGFLDAVLRELIIKCIINSLLSGFLNLGSFIWGCVTDEHKTAHDLAAHTRVVLWRRA
jgi:Predicted membrane protein